MRLLVNSCAFWKENYSGKSQHGFIKNNSWQANQISFWDRVTNCLWKWVLDFSKAFEKNLLRDSASEDGLDYYAVLGWTWGWLITSQMSAMLSITMEALSDVLQSSVLGLVLLNVLKSGLDKELENMVIRCARQHKDRRDNNPLKRQYQDSGGSWQNGQGIETDKMNLNRNI